MNSKELKEHTSTGEDSRHQFKADINNADSLAAEMTAFANCDGGTIFIGVADDGTIPGLSNNDVSRINQLISNTASQHIRSPLTVQTENVLVDNNRVVVILTVPKRIDKPYFDKNGILNIAGVLLFAERPEWIKPQFIIKAVSYPGSLPNNLNIEKIRAGNSNIRNPILASFVAKRLLPYRGLGSGIRRALKEWPDIDFIDDRQGVSFTVIIHRIKGQKKTTIAPLNANKGARPTVKRHLPDINASLSDLQSQILALIRTDTTISYDDIASKTEKDRSTIRRNVSKLKEMGLLHRAGSRKTGYWKITGVS